MVKERDILGLKSGIYKRQSTHTHATACLLNAAVTKKQKIDLDVFANTTSELMIL